MTSEKRTGKDASEKPAGRPPKAQANSPGWADGLRKLYDSVVDEPIPDSFKDLLAKLDESGSSESGQSDGA